MRRIWDLKKVLNTEKIGQRSESVLPIVEILGDKRILIEGHCGICGYCDEKIFVKTKIGGLQVIGSSLQIAEMSKSQLVVTGIIHSLTLQRR